MLCRCSLPHYTESRTWNGGRVCWAGGTIPGTTGGAMENYRWDSCGHGCRHRRGDCHPDSVSVLGPAQVLHDKQAVPLRISGGERRAECRCLRNKTITGSAISLLEESGVRGPVRRSPGYSLFLWYVVLLNKGGDTYERLHEGPAPAVFLGTGASQPLYSPKVNGKRMAPTSPSIQRRRARRSWPG